MPRKSLFTSVKKPRAKKAAKKAAAKKQMADQHIPVETAKTKRLRTKVLKEHPDNIAVDALDHEAIAALDAVWETAPRVKRARRVTAVDLAAMSPATDQPPASSLVERVSDAIERELTKIERIVGSPVRLHQARRIETESRARVLASLARTLKEVMRLREHERAGDDTAKAADDDAVPRDLDEFRRELSRRLEGLVEGRAPPPAGEHEPG